MRGLLAETGPKAKSAVEKKTIAPQKAKKEEKLRAVETGDQKKIKKKKKTQKEMECELQRLESKFTQVPLGVAIARIVRIVVKMAQMDLCQGGMVSVASYGLLSLLFTGSDGGASGDEFTRMVFGALCGEGMRTGEWNRSLSVPMPIDSSSARDKKGLIPLEFTPFVSTEPCVTKNPQLAKLALAVREIMNKGFRSSIEGGLNDQCSSTKTRETAKRDFAAGIVTQITPGDRECTEHVVAAIARALDAQSVRIVEANEALGYIRSEIARAVCAGSIGKISVDGFAAHVAATILDGVCDLRAAWLASGP